MGDPPPLPKRYLVCFVPKDQDGKAELKAHLEVSGTRTIWSVDEVAPGASLRTEFQRAAEGAEAALLLLSADFFAELMVTSAADSNTLLLTEQVELLKQQKARGLRLIPVVWRYCDWQEVPWLAELQALPVNRSAIRAMDAARRDEAFTAIARRLGGERTEAAPSPAEVLSPRRGVGCGCLVMVGALALALGAMTIVRVPPSQRADLAPAYAPVSDQTTAPTMWRVEGLIRDQRNEPLAGVTVTLPERDLTTVTNDHGHFGFAVAAEQSELVLLRAERRAESGGKRRYEPQEIHVNLGSTKLDIVLKDSR